MSPNKVDFIKMSYLKCEYVYNRTFSYETLSIIYGGDSVFSPQQLEQLNTITKTPVIHLMVPTSCFRALHHTNLQDILVFAGAILFIGFITGLFLTACIIGTTNATGSSSSDSLGASATDIIIPSPSGVPTIDLIRYYNTSLWEQNSILNEVESEHVANFPRSVIEPTSHELFLLIGCLTVIVLFIIYVLYNKFTIKK